MKIIHRYLSRLVKLALISLFILSVPIYSYGRDREVSFSWTANSEPSLIGYKLYYKVGPSSAPLNSAPPYNGKDLFEGESPILIDGGATEYTMSGLSADETYHFVLTAYDGDVESDYSAIATVYSNPSPRIIEISTK